MTRRPANPADDKALDAVLANGPGSPARLESLTADEASLAGPWNELARELRDALRMGPGGLSSSQRDAILEAASRPAILQTSRRPLPAPATRPPRGVVWKITGAAAALAAAALFTSQFIPSRGGIDPKAWSAAFAPAGATNANFRVRMFSSPAPGARYAATLGRPVGSNGAWSPRDASAIGPNGGFQPAAMANIAEIIPSARLALEADSLPALLDLATRAPEKFAASDLINLFNYDYPEPAAGEALGMTVVSGPCPWQPGNRLVHIGIRASADPRLGPGLNSLAARDVRLIVDFNPSRVAAYRVIGYHRQDAPDDLAPTLAGADLLAGQSVTAIYEIVPVGAPETPGTSTTWTTPSSTSPAPAADILTAKAVFRRPGQNHQLERLASLDDLSSGQTRTPDDDFRFAAAVAACGLLIERAPGMQNFQIDDALVLARSSIGNDPDGRRTEFISLLDRLARDGI